MILDRRDFLKAAGVTAGGVLLPRGAEAEAQAARFPLHKRVMEARSICPYCSFGCGVIIATDRTDTSSTPKGIPRTPSTAGRSIQSLSPSLSFPRAPSRLKTVLYRAPGSDRCEEKPWEWAIAEIAKRMKTTRDATFIKKNVKA